MNQKGLAPIVIVLILTGAIILAGGGYYLGRSSTKLTNSDISSTVPSPIMTAGSVSEIADETANWETYINKDYGYQIKYPKEYKHSVQKIESNSQEKLKSVDNFLDGFYHETGGASLSGKELKITVYSKDAEIIRQTDVGSPIEYVTIADQKVLKTKGLADLIIEVGPVEGVKYKYDFIYHRSDLNTDLTMFNKMLSTFKFLE